METVKRVLKRIFYLPMLAAVLISIPSFASVIYTLAFGNTASFFAYLSYIASGYALSVTIIAVVRFVRKWRADPNTVTLLKHFADTTFGAYYLNDPMFRAKISLYFGLTLGVLYAFLHLFSGILEGEIWFYALAAYYFLLTLLRYLMLSRIHVGNLLSQYRRCRLCGVLLLGLNQVLIIVVVQIVRENKSQVYPGLLIYAMAAYTFYAVILAICNICKYRNYEKPILLAIKAINLTCALVSLLSLESAMLFAFGSSDDIVFRKWMTALTGVGVCGIVLTISILMIVRSHRCIRKEIFQKGRNFNESRKT